MIIVEGGGGVKGEAFVVLPEVDEAASIAVLERDAATVVVPVETARDAVLATALELVDLAAVVEAEEVVDRAVK